MNLPDGYRFRVDWRGKVVLQKRVRLPSTAYGDFENKYIDAESTDLDKFYKAKGETDAA